MNRVALAAAALLLLAGRSVFSREAARQFALLAALATLFVSLIMVSQFRKLPASETRSAVQPRTSMAYHWLSYGQSTEEGAVPLKFELLFGIDSISLSLIVLTTILTVSCVLISWNSIRDRAAGFYACLLLLEAGLIGVFCAFDAKYHRV